MGRFSFGVVQNDDGNEVIRMAKKLTNKQLRFCEEYLVDLNATQAAIRAGYPAGSAGAIGCENLKKPNISARIALEMAERSKRTGINADRVLEELGKVAFVNPTDLVDSETGEIKESASLEDRAAIAAIRVKQIPTEHGTGVEREVRLTDKIKALELCGKHLGMFANKADSASPVTVVIGYDYGDDDGEND